MVFKVITTGAAVITNFTTIIITTTAEADGKKIILNG